MNSKALFVFMNGRLIGKLEKSNAGLIFAYDSEWLNTPRARPISLSMPLLPQPFVGDVVYNFFDNLLPDNPQLRKQIQAFFQISTDHPFDLLANIGKDCVGAIQICNTKISNKNRRLRYHTLNEKEIASILRKTQTFPLGMTDRTEEFRISIAGAQEKTALLYWEEKWHKPLGITPTTHIFKLPIGYIQHQQIDLSNSCENEWLCSQIVAGFGLPVANCRIEYFKDVKVLIVERFDRKLSNDNRWIWRLPQEDMCQVLGISPNLKYQSDGGPGIEKIMHFLLGSTQPEHDRDLFFRAQIVFWLLAAIDGHAKNFSVYIEPEGRFHLAPLYDILSAYPLIANKQLQLKKIKMAMALKGKNNHYYWDDIQRRHFLSMAKAANYSVRRADDLLNETLNKVDSIINKISATLPNGFPKKISQPIFEGIMMAQKRLK